MCVIAVKDDVLMLMGTSTQIKEQAIPTETANIDSALSKGADVSFNQVVGMIVNGIIFS